MVSVQWVAVKCKCELVLGILRKIFSDMWELVLVWAGLLLPFGPEYSVYRLLYKNANLNIRTSNPVQVRTDRASGGLLWVQEGQVDRGVLDWVSQRESWLDWQEMSWRVCVYGTKELLSVPHMLHFYGSLEWRHCTRKWFFFHRYSNIFILNDTVQTVQCV